MKPPTPQRPQQQDREHPGHDPLRDTLLESSSEQRTHGPCEADHDRVYPTYIPVEGLNHDSGDCDHEDRDHAGPGRLTLSVREPGDQQGDDDRASSHPEQATEQAGGGSDHCQLENAGHDGRY